MVLNSPTFRLFLTTGVIIGLCIQEATTDDDGYSTEDLEETPDREEEENIGNCEVRLRALRSKELMMTHIQQELKNKIANLTKQLQEKQDELDKCNDCSNCTTPWKVQIQEQAGHISNPGISTHHFTSLLWIIPGCLLVVAAFFRSQVCNSHVTQNNMPTVELKLINTIE